MATIKHQFEKETFIPEKNYFKCEWVTLYREETDEEIDLYNTAANWESCGPVVVAVGALLALICGIVFGMLSNQNSWFLVGVVFGFVCLIGAVIFTNIVCAPKELQAREALERWHKEHDEELWADAYAPVLAYNEEQHRIAAEWREQHPLEEKIRACLADPKSSVDIAELARYYADKYIKEDSTRGETVD